MSSLFSGKRNDENVLVGREDRMQQHTAEQYLDYDTTSDVTIVLGQNVFYRHSHNVIPLLKSMAYIYMHV